MIMKVYVDVCVYVCHKVERSVRVATYNLNHQGLRIERNSLEDARKKVIYLLIQPD